MSESGLFVKKVRPQAPVRTLACFHSYLLVQLTEILACAIHMFINGKLIIYLIYFIYKMIKISFLWWVKKSPPSSLWGCNSLTNREKCLQPKEPRCTNRFRFRVLNKPYCKYECNELTTPPKIITISFIVFYAT